MTELSARAEITIAEVTAKAKEVDDLLSRKQNTPALLKALEDPPVLSKDKEIKKVASEAIFKVFDAIPDKDISASVDAVAKEGPARLDLLLKYVYLALATPRPAAPEALLRIPGSSGKGEVPVLAQEERSQLEAILLEQKKRSNTLLKWHPLVSTTY